VSFKRACRKVFTGIIEWLPQAKDSGLLLPVHEAKAPVSRTVRRQRLLAIIAAFAMVVCICGFTAHGFAAQGQDPDHCDWTMHFTGVAGAAPRPAPVARPVLASSVPPAATTAVLRSARRLRAHLARGPPAQPQPASSVA
jgi:hypothetical protein